MPRSRAATVNDKTDEKESKSAMGGLLDLTGADTSVTGDFPAMPAGTYDAEVVEITVIKTKGGENAKLPAETPMLNFHFRITQTEEVLMSDNELRSPENRRVFRSLAIAPEGYEKKAVMDGMLVNTFKALGEDEDTVMSKGYDPDLDSFKGRPCRVVLGKREYPKDSGEYQNDVKSVKAPDDGDGGSSGLL